jgi:putative endonuclease
MGQRRPFSGVTDPHPHPHRNSNRRIALGQDGEDRAAAWYTHRGYMILERNWRSRTGEIDLVCAGHDVIVFCEVKTRHTDRLGAPAEAVTPSKQLRIRRLASEYLWKHTCGSHRVRFDVAAILGSTVTVIENAF